MDTEDLPGDPWNEILSIQNRNVRHGLYLVKQRTEAMNGSVSAESTPGKGSTFSVSLPRLSSEEYEKRMIAVNNNLGGQK